MTCKLRYELSHGSAWEKGGRTYFRCAHCKQGGRKLNLLRKEDEDSKDDWEALDKGTRSSFMQQNRFRWLSLDLKAELKEVATETESDERKQNVRREYPVAGPPRFGRVFQG